MENRLSEILHKKDQFLMGNETLIYVKGNQVVARHNDGETLSEMSMTLKEERQLRDFLWSIYGDEE